MFRLRFDLDLYAGIRPIRLYAGCPTPLRDSGRASTTSSCVRTSKACTRAATAAAAWSARWRRTRASSRERARTHRASRRSARRGGASGAPADGVSRVTCVDKANVLASYAFFREVASEVAASYPTSRSTRCTWTRRRCTSCAAPSSFDVLVAENMFGDILSDLGAGDGRRPRPRALRATSASATACSRPRTDRRRTSRGGASRTRWRRSSRRRMMLDWLGRRSGDEPLLAREAGSRRRCRRCARSGSALTRRPGRLRGHDRLRRRRAGARSTRWSRRRERGRRPRAHRRPGAAARTSRPSSWRRCCWRGSSGRSHGFTRSITITAELALGAPERVDEARARGQAVGARRPARGVKDNSTSPACSTTVGSRLFADRVADDDAEVTRRLRAAGAVILGKANMHELAFGATSRNEAFGHVVNPAAPRPDPGRLERRLRRSGRCRPLCRRDRDGHRRVGAAARLSLRRLGPAPDVRRGVEPRRAARQRSLDTVGPLARSVAGHARGARGDRRLRPARPDLGRADARPRERGGHGGHARGRRRSLSSSVPIPTSPRASAPWPTCSSTLGRRSCPSSFPAGRRAVEACGRLIRAEALDVYREALEWRMPELLEEGTRRRLALATDLEPGGASTHCARSASAGPRAVERGARATVELCSCRRSRWRRRPPRARTLWRRLPPWRPYTHVFSFAHVPALSLPCGVDCERRARRRPARCGALAGQARAGRGRGGAVADELAPSPAVRRVAYAGSIRTTS